ncbi:MAG TPA: hypothetical protein VMS79_04900, partial [Methanomassiliicoccales archaeon]|nr:hypothetical protein [Methanomassiliicoccales archaeon]
MIDVSEGGWNYRVFEGRLKVGVVLVHEILGQDDYARSVGKDLSDQGISVALVDLFKGRLAKDMNEGRFFQQQLQKSDVLDCMEGGRKVLRNR